MIWKLTLITALSLFVIVASGSESNAGQAPDPWADTVVDFVQGDPNIGAFGDPAAALGEPDFSVDPLGGFVSLGFEGQLTLGFDEPILNGPGDDLTIFGDTSADDNILLEISDDGITYVMIPGEVNEHLTSVDIEDFPPLVKINFVRITSLAVGNGAEIDAVGAALNDFDGDGCFNYQEQGADQTFGGLRDPENIWDFFDPNQDGSVTLLDFFAILQRFGAVGDAGIDPLSEPPDPPAYHTRFDRGAVTGPNPWNLGPPNGAISVTDFFSLLVQFGHTCG